MNNAQQRAAARDAQLNVGAALDLLASASEQMSQLAASIGIQHASQNAIAKTIADGRVAKAQLDDLVAKIERVK